MSNVITARVSDDVLALVDHLAGSRERSRSWIVSRLIEEGARREAEFDAFIQQGEDDIAAGRFYTQDEMEAWWAKRKADRAAALVVE